MGFIRVREWDERGLAGFDREGVGRRLVTYPEAPPKFGGSGFIRSSPCLRVLSPSVPTL